MLRRLLTQLSAERTNAERYAEYSIESYQLLVADMTQCIEAETKATSDGCPTFSNTGVSTATAPAFERAHQGEVNEQTQIAAHSSAVLSKDFRIRVETPVAGGGVGYHEAGEENIYQRRDCWS